MAHGRLVEMHGMSRLKIIHGNIVTQQVDAIVNAANETLLGGGGVDGAIHRAAGPELVAACRSIPEVSPGVRCPAGEARITSGFRLAARYVIHTVGPVWQGGSRDEEAMLASCYRQSLALATSNGCRSIAFPAISTGVFRFPPDRAARIAVTETLSFLRAEPRFASILLVAYSTDSEATLREALAAQTGDGRA